MGLKRAALLAASALIATGASPAPPPPPAPPAAPASTPAPAIPRLPGFAAELAQMAPVEGPQAWARLGAGAGWDALTHARPERRQAARWGYACQQLARGLGAEALGALQVMAADDPDLSLVPSFRLAQGVALVLLGRDAKAATMLSDPGLEDNPEAAAWRIRALAATGLAPEALMQVHTALPAINARHGDARVPFVMAASTAALDAGHPAQVLTWLNALPDRDGAANLLRGRALLALGDRQAARLRIERALRTSDPEVRAGARLGLVETAVAEGSVGGAQGIKELDAIRFDWRGGDVEKRALLLTYRLANDAHDVQGALRAGATLMRYFDLGTQSGPVLGQLQTLVSALLAPDSGLSVAAAAGLYWDYREFAPAGAEGDALVARLADSLEGAGLPGRAADLLEYQLTARASDIAQGPLSVKVATLEILAGRPARALNALQSTEQPDYSDEMRWDRKRMEAVALFQLGKSDAAMAALTDVPDAAAVRAEIQWKARDWNALAAGEANLPSPHALSEVGQAIVLRHAIALAMLGREDKLAALRQRYGAAFKPLPSAAAFDLLTRSVGTIDPAAVSRAMAAIPTASPAGAIADLLDVAPAAGG